MEKKKTIFCDIDGTIFKYRKFETYKSSEPELLPGVKKKMDEWNNQGHLIILTTARPEEMRLHTQKELFNNDIPYGRLIMGIERGPRFLINDMDPNKPGKRATEINLERNFGFKPINWKSINL
tara:strand:- start:743 stop:1111 length:369 start_codon:yes stop_codon:yes gene_type:complete